MMLLLSFPMVITCMVPTNGEVINLAVLVPHSGPRSFGLALEITVGMATEKVCSRKQYYLSEPKLYYICIYINANIGLHRLYFSSII